MKSKKSAYQIPNRSEETVKIAATAIVLIAGTWLILKISKEMLKELEGMGL